MTIVRLAITDFIFAIFAFINNGQHVKNNNKI